MADEMIEEAEIPLPYEDIRLVMVNETVGIDFFFRDPASKTPRRIRAWLDLPQAAILSDELATICRQFGVEPPRGRETLQ